MVKFNLDGLIKSMFKELLFYTYTITSMYKNKQKLFLLFNTTKTELSFCHSLLKLDSSYNHFKFHE